MNLPDELRRDQKPKRNALEPGLWLVAALIGVCAPILIWAPFAFAAIYLALTVIVVLSVLGVFIRHSVTDPSLLRSDQHSIQSKALDLLADDIRAGPHVRSLFAPQPLTITQYVADKAEEDR